MENLGSFRGMTLGTLQELLNNLGVSWVGFKYFGNITWALQHL